MNMLLLAAVLFTTTESETWKTTEVEPAGAPGAVQLAYSPRKRETEAITYRRFWVDTLVRIVNPVVTNLAAGTLHANLPRRAGTWTDDVAELEAFGRVMTGLGPWLELPDDETREGALRATAQNGNRIWHEMR